MEIPSSAPFDSEDLTSTSPYNMAYHAAPEMNIHSPESYDDTKTHANH